LAFAGAQSICSTGRSRCAKRSSTARPAPRKPCLPPRDRTRPRTRAALEEQRRNTAHRDDNDLVFCHPQLGTPPDPSKLARCYLKPALKRAVITKPFRPFHDLRHTSLTHAAAGNPQIYVQARAGHAQGSITERYMHAAQILFLGAAERSKSACSAAHTEARFRMSRPSLEGLLHAHTLMAAGFSLDRVAFPHTGGRAARDRQSLRRTRRDRSPQA
jgi:hypothetical protein